MSVGFDAGGRAFVLSGVGVPVSCVAASGGSGVGGVRVCVPCARVVFGVSWCSLVLRRWARAAGVDGAKVDGLLGSGDGGGGSAASLCSHALVVASSPDLVPLSGSAAGSVSSASLRSPVGGGRVGAGFGARVRDWGARVGVGGGVVSGGGVIAGWWSRAVGRVRRLASSVGVWGLVGLCGVFFVVLVSALVLVG